MSIRCVSSRVVYQNSWMTVREDEVDRGDGQRGIYALVEKHDSAIILALEDDSVYLVEQFRYPIGEASLEFPQGSLEQDGIAPIDIAREELAAETGIEAERFEYLGEIVIAVGYSNQKTHAFLATGLSHGTRRPDREEHDLVVRKTPLAEFERMVAANVIKDAQTLAAWTLYRSRPHDLSLKA